ncbi:MAG: DUF2804 domain-containing protein [Treponema sp.]|jgi:hypothetical protein|nr:DUF2804 domain-containing protein [Treponema sp.]
MYTREIQPPRSSPVEQGKPLQGTWVTPFKTINLLDIERPFFFPFPKWVQDLRLKEWETFLVQDERFCLSALFGNFKTFRWAQALLYDKGAKKLLKFSKFLPFSGWHIPSTLSNASLDSHSYNFFFRIHDWLEADTIHFDLHIGARLKQSAFTAHMKYDVNQSKTTPLAVNLLFSERRCMSAFKVICPIQGDIVFDGRHIVMDKEHAQGFFGNFRGYFPYRARAKWCTAFTIDEQGHYGFSLADNQTKESFKNNENVLWMNGRLTHLPPVRITMPKGPDSDWIIQDMEGMVDLVFTPVEPVHNVLDILVVKSEYDMPLGYFNGILLDAEGTRIQARNLWGLGENIYLRV